MIFTFLWWSLSRFCYVLRFLNIDKPNFKVLKSGFKTRKHLYGFEVFHLFWKMCIGTWEPIKCKDMELNCILYFLVSSNFVQTFQCQWTLCIMHYALYDCNLNLLAQTTMYTRNIGSNLKDDHIYYVLFMSFYSWRGYNFSFFVTLFNTF